MAGKAGNPSLRPSSGPPGIDRTAQRTSRAERLVSVCTRAILLAAAGLLDGHRATPHWAYCGKLARDHPAIEVDPTQGSARTRPRSLPLPPFGAARRPRILKRSRDAVQLGTEHDPQPPYDAGSPEKAPEHIVAELRARSRFILTWSR
ncbi:hypothetical protein [Streptomyces sp. NPDC001315]|uniref:hypothetical protein n=1 Tax=Streptomyces sp. NPDC001315 TaxID=3364562 RepID=UPI0036A6DA1C